MSFAHSALLAATYFVLTFPIAAVWHLVLFKDVYSAASLRKQPVIPLGVLSTVLQAVVVAYLYPRVAGGGAPVAEGLKFGLLMGVFFGSYGALAEAAKFEIGPVARWVLYEGLFFLVQWAILGVAVGLVAGALA